MSEHDWLRDPEWPRIVTTAEWTPGLPPPIEALHERFRPELDWKVEYATYIERDESGGWRSIPVAYVSLPGRETLQFFPERPRLGPLREPKPVDHKGLVDTLRAALDYLVRR